MFFSLYYFKVYFDAVRSKLVTLIESEKPNYSPTVLFCSYDCYCVIMKNIDSYIYLRFYQLLL